MIRIKEIINDLEKFDVLDQLILNHNDFSDINTLTDLKGKISVNSKDVAEEDLFICIKGFSVDGHDLALDCVNKGARVIVCEREIKETAVLQILVKDSRKAMSIIAQNYYDYPSKSLKLIAITGTNGKTTIASLVMQLLLSQGKSVAMIGSVGIHINGTEYISDRKTPTTPDSLELQEIFSVIKKASVEYVVMEVSSHAIALSRVFGLKFDVCAFTNLTQDHLDFHKDMEDYGNTKKRLFTEYMHERSLAVINIDDQFGRTIFNELSHKKIAVSLKHENIQNVENYYLSDNLTFDINRSHFDLVRKISSRSIFSLSSRLIGDFNIQNMLTALAINDCLLSELNENMIDQQVISKEIILSLVSAKGRIECVENNLNLGIFIDYAHTPDAIENVLKTLTLCKKQMIITLIGAGGNRDQNKRPKMAESALKYSDIVIFCDDNPREEKPAQIIRDMVQNLDPEDPFIICRDRKKAIKIALTIAKEHDLILLAGKGHETYQEIKGIKYPFDERNIVNSLLNEESDHFINDDHLAVEIDILNFEKWFGLSIDDHELDEYHSIKKISTDSRTADEHSLFIALKGEKYDGAAFIKKIPDYQNVWCLINNSFEEDFDSLKVLKVADTVNAYGFIAGKLLSLFRVKKIALTGSTGKTTTKEYIKNILETRFNVLTNIANENNLIGVPKTILNIRPENDVVLLEMGTNQFGEIERMARIVKPHIGLIINIGPSHLEYLIDEEGVFKEKSKLFDYCQEVIIFPEEDKKFRNITSDCTIYTLGRNPQSSFMINDIQIIEDRINFKLNENEYKINDNVLFKVTNASYAIIIGRVLGLGVNEIQNGLIKKQEISYRMKIIETDDHTLLVDCYNANPVSMSAAIDYWLSYQSTSKHYAILGDMLELGEHSEYYHQQIKDQLDQHKINNNVICIGEKSQIFNPKRYYKNVEEFLGNEGLSNIPKGSVVLIKASHGIHLEKIVER